jgi:predicted metal-dependent hydrolase
MNGMITVQIPYEVTDEIVVKTMQESREMIKEQLQEFYEKTSWLHPDDVRYSYEVLNALEVLLEYYGGKELREGAEQEEELRLEEEEEEDGPEEPEVSFNDDFVIAFLDTLDNMDKEPKRGGLLDR